MPSDTPQLALIDTRAWMVDRLTELVPDTWDVRPGLSPIGTITKPTLLIEYKTIDPFDAPMGNVRVAFEVYIVDHHEDQSKAEDAVDGYVVALMVALDQHPSISWSTASKTGIADTPYLGWKFTVSAIASKTTDS